MFGIGMGTMGALKGGNSLSSKIRNIFTANAGAWYDYALLTQEFQDSAGTIPVTAAEQPLGKVNDQSGGGNHLAQATSAARPVLSALRNMLLKSEVFTDALWVKGALYFATENAATAPDGAMTADLYGPTSGQSSFTSSVPSQTVVLGPAGSIYTISRYVKFVGAATSLRVLPHNTASGATVGGIARTDGTFAPVGDGVSFGSASGTMVAVGNGWWRYTLTFTVLLNNISFKDRTFPYVGGTVLTGDGASGIYNWGAQLVQGADKRYQRVNTAADYDAVGFPLYAKLDGIDDGMATTTGGGASGFFFCQVVRPTGGAGTVRTLASDTGVNTGYKVQIDAANKLSFSAGNGTAYTSIASASNVDVGVTVLITAWDDGTNLNVQIGAGAVASVARPTVLAGTAGFTVGKDNGAATGYFAGNLYPEIYVKNSGLTALQRVSAQSWCKSKAEL
jgi:hypothetical protein